MHILIFIGFVFSFISIIGIITAFEFKYGDVVLKYRITDMKQCQVSGTVLKTVFGVALGDCVYNCEVREECDVMNYERRYKKCELRSSVTGNDNAMDSIKGCVTVRRSDISVVKVKSKNRKK
jgi:hypothetical protein